MQQSKNAAKLNKTNGVVEFNKKNAIENTFQRTQLEQNYLFVTIPK